jgi:hypothetical protein
VCAAPKVGRNYKLSRVQDWWKEITETAPAAFENHAVRALNFEIKHKSTETILNHFGLCKNKLLFTAVSW